MLKLTVLYLILLTFLLYHPFQISLIANPYSGLHFSLGGIIKLSSVRCESLVTLPLLEHGCFIFTITHGSIKRSSVILLSFREILLISQSSCDS